MENSMEVPLKIKSRTTILSSNPASKNSRTMEKELKVGSGKDIYIPMFRAALFILTKCEQPK
jgi:hypothetical protein